MNSAATSSPVLWPFLVYLLLVIVLAVGILVVSFVLGERHKERSTDEPYESGMQPTGSARLRFPADFYLIAMFFVIFDLETVFIVAWAVAMSPLGWRGYVEMLVFIGVLLVALAYLWRSHALDWGSARWKHRGEEMELCE